MSLLTDHESTLTADDFKSVFRRMYANRYFTNHGPLAIEFEQRLEDVLQVENVVTVGNESLALLIALAGLELEGDLVVPVFCGALPNQIGGWLGLQIRHCDIDPATHQASIDTLDSVVDDNVQAVCLIETWGNRADRRVIDWLIGKGVFVIVLALDSFASEAAGRFAVDHDQVITVYGFGPDQILSTTQGGAIAASDHNLAERYRNIRSSYGTRQKVDVKATCNGRFSEFQAGVGLAGLAKLRLSLERNRSIAETYSAILRDVPGMQIYSFAATDATNGQYFPIMIDEPALRNPLRQSLADRGYQTDVGKPSTRSLPVSDLVNQRLLLLPVNNEASEGMATRLAEQICELH